MPRLLTALALIFALSPAAAASTAPSQDIYFKVYRDGAELGHHRVTFSRQGEQTIADIDIEFAVSFAGIRVFHYLHRSRETWQGGVLQAVQSTTNDDGDEETLNVSRDAQWLKIDGAKFKGEAPGDLMPTSYWFPQTLSQTKLIDTINGRVFPVVIAKVGTETIEAGGKSISATHYTLSEQLKMNLWYDDQGNWVKSSFAIDGSQIDYVLQLPTAAKPLGPTAERASP